MGDLSGNWEVQVRFVRGEARHAVQLQQDGEQLSGRYRSHFGEHEVRGRVRQGKVEMAVGIYYQGVGTRYSNGHQASSASREQRTLKLSRLNSKRQRS